MEDTPSSRGGPPDLTGLSKEEIAEVVVKWVRADPKRKADVMDMLPTLSKEIM